MAIWGGLVPQEKMVRREQRDLRGPLARLGSRAPEDSLAPEARLGPRAARAQWELTVRQVPKEMWVLQENKGPQDSREIPGPRDSLAPRDPLALLGRRVPPDTQEFQASRDLMALRVTQATRGPQERKGPRAQQGPQARGGILGLGV